MATSINLWLKIKNSEPIGEVFSIDGDYIDIFIYPEYLPWIKVGEILAIETDWGYAIGITLHTSYRAQRSFRALKLNIDMLRKNIPDIYRFHILLTKLVYTSRFENGEVKHMKGGSPLLHSLTYTLPNDTITNFFKPKDKLDLTFLRRYIINGASPDAILYFIDRYKDVINTCGLEYFLQEFAKIVSSIEGIDPLRYIRAISEYMGWF